MRMVCLICLLGATTMLVGCGEERNWPVQGKVMTTDGKPLPGALVNFVMQLPDGKTYYAVSKERTDANGEFVLVQDMSNEGCKVGEYKVMITTGKQHLDEETGDPIIVSPEVVSSEYYGLGTCLTAKVEPKEDNYIEFTVERAQEDE